MPSTIDECYQDISKFQSAKQNIYNVINNILNASNGIEVEKKNIENVYLVNNDNTPIVTKIDIIYNDANKISNYLKNIIIPAIDSTISDLYRRINQLQEEERRKAMMMNSFNNWW